MNRKRRDFLSGTAVAATLAAAHPLLAQSASAGDPAAAKPPASGTATASPGQYVAPSEIKKIEFNSLRDLDGEAQKVLPADRFPVHLERGQEISGRGTKMNWRTSA